MTLRKDGDKLPALCWLFCVCYHRAMTAPIYTRAKAAAIRGLALYPKGKGASLTLHRVTGGGEYIAGGGETAITQADYLGSGIRTAYRLQDVDGTLVQAGDVRFLVCPILQDNSDMPTPQTGDTLTFGSVLYNVVTCKPWQYDGETSAGFEVQARE